MKKTMQKGFTLIELLVVIAIIAILALIVLLALNPVEMQRRSRDSRRLSDMGTLRKAIDLALADGETLPTCGTTTVNTAISSATFGCAGSTMDISKYLSVVPEDPYHGTGTTQLVTDGSACTVAAGTPAYQFSADGDTYELRSRMESKENCNAVDKDGGEDANYYEIGTDPGLNAM
jgi:prepilin-type N-terminal cleavage/methylation domain-containing protein